MKKIFTLCLLTTLLLGCAVMQIETKVGMPEEEFKKRYHSSIIYSMDKDKTVYMVPWSDNLRRFFSFEQGKLVQIHTLERQPDVVIQHEKKLITEQK